MRRYRAALTAATALTLMLVTTTVVAGPAEAGGPTSVLMVVPGTGQTSSLYTGDGDYEALANTVGAFSPDGATGKVDGSPTDHASGTGVTLTWLIHDVQVWRVDRVYLDAEGGPWILSTEDHSGTGIWDKPATWHTADDPEVLVDVLERHGVAGVAGTDATDSTAGQPDVAAVPDAPAANDTNANDTTGSSEQAAESTGSRAAMLAWGFGGLALGIALTLAAIRLGQRSRTASDQPAQDQPRESADVSPDRVPDTAPWSTAEELQRR